MRSMSERSGIGSSESRAPAFCRSSTAAAKRAETVSSRSASGRPCGTPKRRPASRAGAGVAGSSPAMTASAAAQSATLAAIGPIESSVKESGKAPPIGTRRWLGLKPTMPHSAAGMRVEPPVSEPMAIAHMPSATATAPPEVEPPGMRARSAGLPGVP